METYILELQKLREKLLRLMAKALELDEKEMMEYFEDGMQSIKMTYYPPCPQLDLVMGITPHFNSTLLIILLQLNCVEDLHNHKDNVWFPVNILPNALIVNIGDILE
ncbi:hypothetical protein Gorai_022996, partial [Gossypium raimondii]|nr:hypothetical protein [Gossypium raimondii]